MKPLAKTGERMKEVFIKTGDNTSMKMRLGDIFVTESKALYARNGEDLDEFLPLALMPVAFRTTSQGYDITYFFMASLYKYDVTVSKIEDNSLHILKKGKEVKFGKSRVIESITLFADNYDSRTSIKGIDIYSRILISRSDQIALMYLKPINVRLMDLSLWPRKAIDVWVDKQLRLNGSHMRERAEEIRDKNEVIEMVFREYIADRIARERFGKSKSAPTPYRSYRYRHGDVTAGNRVGVYKHMKYINLTDGEFGDGRNMAVDTDLRPSIFEEHTIICRKGTPEYIITQGRVSKTIYIRFAQNDGDDPRMVLPVAIYSNIAHDEILAKKLGIEDRPLPEPEAPLEPPALRDYRLVGHDPSVKVTIDDSRGYSSGSSNIGVGIEHRAKYEHNIWNGEADLGTAGDGDRGVEDEATPAEPLQEADAAPEQRKKVQEADVMPEHRKKHTYADAIATLVSPASEEVDSVGTRSYKKIDKMDKVKHWMLKKAKAGIKIKVKKDDF